jgi:hypothetical protein
MTSIFVTATIIAISYFIVKFLEMRYIEKESKPLKVLVKDTLLVYFSVIIANFVMEQINPVIISTGGKSVIPVFTDEPTF